MFAFFFFFFYLCFFFCNRGYGGGGGLTVSGVSRNGGGFVKCVAIQKRLGIPDLINLRTVKVEPFKA
jgi:hypothetical protein